ncbi:MAG TPA: PP2C family protein-serine/threonine phosphatase, partial [Terriglobales bacterium]|nr:PP2C family protein-serine/threonine phosphatase [Terriglobales bacterium]
TLEVPFSSGDTLAFYTDGITESCNRRGEEFGEERLAESLRRSRKQPAQLLVAAIADDVRKFSTDEQSDDRTLIVAHAR